MTHPKYLAEGTTESGTHVVVIESDGGYMERFKVFVDGMPVGYTNASRKRDGGSTLITTTAGKFYANRKLGTDPWEEWNGERLR